MEKSASKLPLYSEQKPAGNTEEWCNCPRGKYPVHTDHRYGECTHCGLKVKDFALSQLKKLWRT